MSTLLHWVICSNIGCSEEGLDAKVIKVEELDEKKEVHEDEDFDERRCPLDCGQLTYHGVPGGVTGSLVTDVAGMLT